MAISKLILNGVTQMDVTDTTATVSDVASGKVFTQVDGTTGTGTASVGGWSIDGLATRSEPSGDIVISTSSNLGSQVFRDCINITGVIADNTKTIGTGDFYGCRNIQHASFKSVEIIADDAFQRCYALETIDVRNLIRFSTKRGFKECSSLREFVGGLTKLTTVSDECFYGIAVQTIVLPKITSGLAFNLFYNCVALETVDVGASSGGISTSVFKNSTSFNTLILRNASLRSLGNINSFDGTPFASGGSGGTLYVPNDLIASYQSASNWSTILGYTNNQIKSIESTHTDPTAPIDLTLYYADGTLIPT